MASPFATAGLGQFGQDAGYQSGSGAGFLAGLGAQKIGLEDYLNKNFGASFAGGKLSTIPKPTGAVVPNDGTTTSPTPVAPPGDSFSPTTMMGQAPSSSPDALTGQNMGVFDGGMDAIHKMGADILNGGKTVAASFLGL